MKKKPSILPEKALNENIAQRREIAACEHFAGNEKFIRRSLDLQRETNLKFDLTCDCEDGAQLGDEIQHAKMISKVIKNTEIEKQRVGVRVPEIKNKNWKKIANHLIGECGDKLSYITIPKVDSYKEAAIGIEYIKTECQKNNQQILVHILVETQNAANEVDQIATIEGIETLDFGLLDFVSDHQGALSHKVMNSPEQFTNQIIIQAKAKIVAAALRNNLTPTHNPCMDFENIVIVSSDANTARQTYGFLRMYSIHPAQIKPIISAMQPSETDIEFATNILLKAQENNWGPINFEGEMHDRASYRYFWNVLKRARSTGLSIATVIENRFFREDN